MMWAKGCGKHPLTRLTPPRDSRGEIMSHLTIASTSTLGQMVGVPFLQLVDIDGFDVSPGEKNYPQESIPFDPDEETDPATWPAEYDNWFYETDEILPEDLAF